MARKKNQISSGNFRVQAYDYTDINGKKHYKSFTAPTKKQAQVMAAEWKENRRTLKTKLTVYDACLRYIELKRNVLSPSTIRGYNTSLKRIGNHPIAHIDLSVISNQDIQRFVSDMAMECSPKTVKNFYGLIASSIGVFIPDFRLHVTLPKMIKPSLYIPSTADVQILLDHCTTVNLKLAVLFSAVGTMRRGEACAVTFDDINYNTNTININKSYVKSEYGWELKAPKTYESYRLVRMPQYVIDMIRSLDRSTGRVLDLMPDQLYGQFRRTLLRSGLPEFRYHDLRHHAASQMHAYGVPDRYIEAIGGWKPGSNVLKRTYENVIDLEMIKQQNMYLEKNKFSV